MNDISVPQWRPLLSSLADTLTQDVTPALLAQWMRRSGVRFAHEHVLAAAGTVGEMQAVMNASWSSLGWGHVTIREASEWLELTHQDAPLEAAFGTKNVAWAASFLEGTYEAWMHQLGADTRLRMTLTSPAADSGNMVFRFGM